MTVIYLTPTSRLSAPTTMTNINGNIIKAYIIILLTALTGVLSGCQDDLLYDPEIGKGESNLDITMGFEQMFVGLDNSTRTAGDAINTINHITVVAYNQNGTLYKVWRSKDGDFSYTISDNKDMPSDYDPSDYDPNGTGNNQHQAEVKTPQASFKLSGIPFGRYYIYAIANLDVTDDQVETAQQMKEIVCEWQTDVKRNNAMFGYFTDDRSAGVRPQSFDARQLTINKSGMKIWAWLKRTVSKVTIAFDGRRLNENVTIYLKNVTIKDIPKYCWLGRDNKPGWDGTSADMSELIKNGESIVYGTGDSYGENWEATISKGNPIYGAMGRHTHRPAEKPDDAPIALSAKEQIDYQHSETAPALYFFENIQPDGEKGTESDKRQDVGLDGNDKNDQISYPDGNDPNDAAHKDARPYGSYIEVHAYYINTSSANNTQGDIIYRFMLGQDDWLDYSALRNRHYKLTMTFNGNANDVDWHIVYTEPKVRFPRPYYISYLYNHKMMCPITIDAGDSEVKSIKATIISNAWAPDNMPENLYWSAMNQPETYPYNGFLSLHETDETTIRANRPFKLDANQAYYNTDPKRGERTFTDFTDGDHTTDGALPTDVYYVKRSYDEDTGSNIFDLSVPMYTRAKQLVKQTAYTGNNPYTSYTRSAYVQLDIELKNGVKVEIEEPLHIIQVRRIVNPKGIYRKHNSTKPFHVNLKYTVSEEGNEFKSEKSLSGPWKAYIVRSSSDDADLGTKDAHTMIQFSGQDNIYTSNDPLVSDTIYGRTGSEIDFDILFNGTCNENESRHAVIRVEYHNYTCYHLIFVRQGNAPVKLISGGAKWHNTNMISKTQEAETPIDEGSLFKFGNWDWPIASTSNVNSKSAMIYPDDFKGNSGNNLTIVGKSGTYHWDDKDFTNQTNAGGVFADPSSTMKVAGFWDYAALYKGDTIEQGFGVLYGDDATTTSSKVSEAYGYVTGKPGSYGMRGCFVYNSINGVHIFFPTGNSGFGHRKNSGTAEGPEAWPSSTKGLLRYSCNGRWGYFPTSQSETLSETFIDVYPEFVNDCPLFWDIFRRPGAIYWLKNDAASGQVFYVDGVPDPDVARCMAWDFNYFTFDFYGLASTNLGYGADACFVRCVDK